MKHLVALLIMGILLLSKVTIAAIYEKGWGKTPEAAMDAAKGNIGKGKCLCTDEGDRPDYVRDCTAVFEGFVCTVCSKKCGK